MSYINFKIKKEDGFLYTLEVTKDNFEWKLVAHSKKYESVKAIARLYFPEAL